ncbi:hypothetical protein GJAV_G00256370 [Gymnothorax javanicus]|nr:hypothetical protein GJAV_G00256370 [Gymnothorax javanicus]
MTPSISRTLQLLLLLLTTQLLTGTSATPTQDCSPMSTRLRSFKLLSRCNLTVLADKQRQEVQAPTTVVLVPCLYLLAFIIGLPTNLIALWVLVFRTKKLPSTTLLINLTATDLMLLAFLPFRIFYHFNRNDWTFGEPFCRLVTALFYGNMYGSVLCLMLISVDRYVALVHPFGARTMRSRRVSLCMSAAVWAVVLTAMLPLLISRQSYPLDEPRITTCHDALPEDEQEHFFYPYFTSLFTVGFLLPLLVILFCYGSVLHTLLVEGKRYAHAIRVTVLVLVVFIICFLPSNLLLLLHYSDSFLMDDEQDLYVAYMISLAASSFNSCFDPLIFYFVSEDFRAKVRKALICCAGVNLDVSSANQISSSTSGQSRKSQSTLLSKFATTEQNSN